MVINNAIMTIRWGIFKWYIGKWGSQLFIRLDKRIILKAKHYRSFISQIKWNLSICLTTINDIISIILSGVCIYFFNVVEYNERKIIISSVRSRGMLTERLKIEDSIYFQGWEEKIFKIPPIYWQYLNLMSKIREKSPKYHQR